MLDYAINISDLWIEELTIRQAKIELGKQIFDDHSLKNILVLLIKIPVELEYFTLLSARLNQWLNENWNDPVQNIENIKKSANQFINTYISVTHDIDKAKKFYSIDKINGRYWQVLKKLEHSNVLAYMYILMITMAKNSQKSAVIDELAKEAEQVFMGNFEYLFKQYPNHIAEVFSFAIQQTQYSNYSRALSPILDQIFDKLVSINETFALQILDKSYDFFKHDRMSIWSPKNGKYRGWEPDLYI